MSQPNSSTDHGAGVGRLRRAVRRALAICLGLGLGAGMEAADWPQFRNSGDGVSSELIATTWVTNSPTFGVWTNKTVTNGFSSFSISQGRAFTQSTMYRSGTLKEMCYALDAATGTLLWSNVIGSAPWTPSSTANGGDGTAPCNTGDGPRTTPAAQDGRVIVLSGVTPSLVCFNATNGAKIWSNNLSTLYGAVAPSWNYGASPRLDNDLIFLALNTVDITEMTAFAFSVTNGQAVWTSASSAAPWSSAAEQITHSTPAVATIQGVRQVLFATSMGIVGLDRNTGAFLWEYPYPFTADPTALGASPVVWSNVVFTTGGYGRGSGAARITNSSGVWTNIPLWTNLNVKCRSIWMAPVAYQGYVYGQFGDKTYLTCPLNCIDIQTGVIKWSTNNFGQGGTILVGTNLLVLTEDGQLVLAKANPTNYTELARCSAFQFSASTPGKCWNGPAFSDGRIYARSTIGALSLNVAVAVGTLPALATTGASNITATTATIYGTVNPNSTSTGARFQWGATTNYGSTTTWASNLTGATTLVLSNALSGLTPGTTYHFRLTATNSAGTTNGSDVAFTTLALAPSVATAAAMPVGSRSATLNGSVNPNGGATKAWFQWGTTTNYGSYTTTNSLAATNFTLGIGNLANGLTPGTLYHFRAVATNSAGTNYGADLSFTAAPDPPTATTLAATGIGAVSATLNGTVNPNGGATTAFFEWGPSTAYGNRSPALPNLTGNSPLEVTNLLTGLTSASTYHFRLMATNTAGTNYGTDQLFLTLEWPRLKLFPPQVVGDGQVELVVGTVDGTPVDAGRLPKISVLANPTATGSRTNWPTLGAPLVLTSNGTVRLTNTVPAGQTEQYYQTKEQP